MSSLSEACAYDVGDIRKLIPKSAISDELIVALIVQYHCPFQATIKGEVKNNIGLTFFGWPWSKPDDPLRFDPNISLGFKAKTTGKFENLSDDEWGILLGLRGEWEVCLASLEVMNIADQQLSESNHVSLGSLLLIAHLSAF